MTALEFKQRLAECNSKKEIFDPQYTTWGELSTEEEFRLRAERAGMTVQKALEYLDLQDFFAEQRTRKLRDKIQAAFDTALYLVVNPD